MSNPLLDAAINSIMRTNNTPSKSSYCRFILFLG